MPQFSYVARDAAGGRIEGVLEGADPREAALRLRGMGSVPLTIVAVPAGREAAAPAATGGPSAGEPRASALASLRRFGRIEIGTAGGRKVRVGDVELQMFTRELHALIKAGIPVMRALDLLRESTVSPALADLLGRIRVHLDAGLDLPDAFERENQTARVFSAYYLAILRVGSYTGRLDECLLRLSQALQFQREMKEQVKTALRYPVFVVVAAIAAIVIINLFVLPQFERVFSGMKAELPLLTRMLIASSRTFVQWWWLIALLAGLAAFGLRQWLRTGEGQLRRDAWMLKAPVFGDIVERTCLARFAHALALAMRSGVPLVQGLEIVSLTVDNRRFEQAILEVRDRVGRGDSIRMAAAGTGMFPKPMLQVIAVGEETGALDGLLEQIGDFYRGEVEYATSRLSARIEPILITGLGVVVLVLALGVFMPMWELGRAAMGRA
jgi:MSHA biogenesis protein MshG